MPGLILLRDIRPFLRVLDVRCSRCPRAGRMSVARLVNDFGPDAPVHRAWEGLNAGCPNERAIGAGKSCSLHAPALVALRLGGAPEPKP